MLPVTPGLLEFGKGLVTLLLAIAAAAKDDTEALFDGSTSSVESPSAGGDGSEAGRGRAGLKTGAAADILEALAADGKAGVDVDARRLGGVVLRSGILERAG